MTLPRTVLISVYQKDGIVQLAQRVNLLKWQVVSTGGTAKSLIKAGIPVVPIEKLTGNPEAFSGRIKSISFQIEAGILFDRGNPLHKEEADRLNITPIDMVVCNFYPFSKEKALEAGISKAIELIDVGGPAMVRSAAKNYRDVIVIIDPADYDLVCSELEEYGDLKETTRIFLASKAFKYMVNYDSMIDTFFADQAKGEQVIHLRLNEGRSLRYGENPHQKGSFFSLETDDPLALKNYVQLHGKELSFNNFLDLDTVVSFLSAQGGTEPASVIVKHTNPCGASIASTIEEAFQLAWVGDSLAAYGGIAGINRTLSYKLAETIINDKLFIDLLIAPGIDQDALELLKEKRKSLILLTNPALSIPPPFKEMDMKKVRGGMLVQEPDTHTITENNLQIITGSLDKKTLEDLTFAWITCQHLKSNSVALVRNRQLVGSGAGQQDRKRSCKLAVEKAGECAKGAVAASDAFFPFNDGPKILIDAGVKAILHPGGSIRDQETIDLCRSCEITLVTTGGVRCFKH